MKNNVNAEFKDKFGESIEEFVSSHYPVDDGELKELLTEYIMKFVVPYPTFGPLEKELLQHCLKVGKSIDDLPEDDEIYNKYYNEDILY